MAAVLAVVGGFGAAYLAFFADKPFLGLLVVAVGLPLLLIEGAHRKLSAAQQAHDEELARVRSEQAEATTSDPVAEARTELAKDVRKFENRLISFILSWSRLRPSGPESAIQLDSATGETEWIKTPPTPEQFAHDQRAKQRWLDDHLKDALDLCDRLIADGYAASADRQQIADAMERDEVIAVYEQFATWLAWVNIGFPRARIQQSQMSGGGSKRKPKP